MLREILKRLIDTKHEQIDRLNFDECKHRLKDIKNQKILLAIDNVSESYEIVEQAKLILRAGFAKSSIVIVTARSLGELQNLNLEESECLEMPELTEDDAISLFVREVACDISTNERLIRHCVGRCYFSKGDGANSHYHPLALRVLGGQLGSDSSQWLEKLKEFDVFNQYREKLDKHPIFSILRRSFDVLNDEDKLLFMDCALFVDRFSYLLTTHDFFYQWLSMMHGKQIKSRLNGLKWKSLIQSLEDDTPRIGIHDLWREFCVMETKVGGLESRRWIYEKFNGTNDPCIEESSIHIGVWKRAQRVSLNWIYSRTSNVHLNLGCCSSLTSLDLVGFHLEGNVLDFNGAYNLKSLIISISSICKVLGLRILRQLCVLDWCGEMPSNMAFIEEIGGLTNLQVLNLSTFGSSAKIGFPNLSNLSLLQRVAFSGLDEGVSISFNSTMSNLQELHLEFCESLQRCNGLGDLVELELLEICECPNFEELPNLQVFKNLRVLQLRHCSLNKVVMGLSELINFQECTISMDGIGEFNDLHKLTEIWSIGFEGWNLQGSLVVDNLVNLEELSIEDCRSVDSLGGLSKLIGLCHINLRGCDFKNVACLNDLIGLREVSICYCNLLETIPNMHKVTRLETLDIFNCENLQVWDGWSRTRATSSKAIGVDLQSSGTFPNLQQLHLCQVAIIELLDLSNFPKLEVLFIASCQSLVRLTSNVPLISLKDFGVYACKSLTTIPNFNGCKHLESVTVRSCGVTLNKNAFEYLRVLCPTIDIDIV